MSFKVNVVVWKFRRREHRTRGIDLDEKYLEEEGKKHELTKIYHFRRSCTWSPPCGEFWCGFDVRLERHMEPTVFAGLGVENQYHGHVRTVQIDGNVDVLDGYVEVDECNRIYIYIYRKSEKEPYQ